MTVILDLFKWAWKLFWPLIVLTMLIGVHVGAIKYMDFDSAFINKKISLVVQVIGGFLIFYSINANLKIVRNKNLWSLFIDSLRQGSVSKDEPIITNDHSASITLAGVKGQVSLHNDPQNVEDVEEKIEDIEKMIDEMRNEIDESHQQPNHHLNEEIVKVTNDIKATNSDLSKVESKVIKASIPGISLQIFGFMLMVYGAVAGHIA